ncbi:MAG: purine-nucleoside phosphorylase [Bacilli bacterium]
MSTHINALKEDISPIILMPGDPLRAKMIADVYLKNVKIVNYIRGNTAYSGYYKNKFITIFPSGMGIGSMGIYSYELFNDYNAQIIIRIGTAGSYKDDVLIGDVFCITKAFSNSNYASELFNIKANTIESSELLNEKIVSEAKEENIDLHTTKAFTVEAFYGNYNNHIKKAIRHNLLLAEMESFALFANAMFFGKQATSILTVSDIIGKTKQVCLSSEEREKKLTNMIELALNTVYKL